MYLGMFFSTNIIMLAVVSSLSYFFLKFCFKNSLDNKIFNFIFFYHLVFIFYFLIFAKNNDTDSLKYFYDASNGFFSGKIFYFGGNFVKMISYNLIKMFNLDYITLNIVFGSIGTFGFLILASLIQSKFYENKILFYILILTLCVPTLNLFTTHIGKDSLMFFAICLFIWSIDNLNRNYKKYITLILALTILAFTRLHLAVPILFISSLFFPFIVENLSKYEKRIYFIFLVFLISAIFYFQIELLVKAGIISELGGMHKNPSLNDLGYIFEKMKVYSSNTDSADSVYKINHENNFAYYFKYLFGPFILEKKFQTIYLLAKFESLYYFILILIMFFLLGLNYKNRPILIKNLMIIGVFLALTIPLSFSVSNYGISIRQRIVTYPFIIYFLIFNIEYLINEKKNNFNIFKSNNY